MSSKTTVLTSAMVAGAVAAALTAGSVTPS